MATIQLDNTTLSSVRRVRLGVQSLQASTDYNLVFHAVSNAGVTANITLQLVTHYHPGTHSTIVSDTDPASEVLHHPSASVNIANGSGDYSVTLTTSAFTHTKTEEHYMIIKFTTEDPITQKFWTISFSTMLLEYIDDTDVNSVPPPNNTLEITNLYYDLDDAAAYALAGTTLITLGGGGGGGDATLANQLILLGRLSAARAGYLDNINQAGLLQITAARAGYLDNLSAGAVALASTALSTAIWTGARASYIDELAAANIPTDVDTLKQRSVTHVSMMEFWSDLDDIITLTTATINVDLPNVVVANLPANTTILRVIGLIRIRAMEDTSGATNAINGANTIKVKKSTGDWGVDDVALIDIVDNIWSVSASTKEGGMVIEGDNNASGEVDGNATYNIRFNGNIFVDGNNLNLIDVAVGLKVYFIAT